MELIKVGFTVIFLTFLVCIFIFSFTDRNVPEEVNTDKVTNKPKINAGGMVVRKASDKTKPLFLEGRGNPMFTISWLIKKSRVL